MAASIRLLDQRLLGRAIARCMDLQVGGPVGEIAAAIENPDGGDLVLYEQIDRPPNLLIMPRMELESAGSGSR